MAKEKQIFYSFQKSHVNNADCIRVGKLNEDMEPLDLYTVIIPERGAVTFKSCDCMSRKRPCKHYNMVQEWLKLKTQEHVYYDSIKHEFVQGVEI